MDQYINNIAEKLLGYKGFHAPIVNVSRNTNKVILIDHVNRWLAQFKMDERNQLAKITSYLLDGFFIEEEDERGHKESLFAHLLISNNGYVATPLKTQGNGESQENLVTIYEDYVRKNNLLYNQNVVIYIDDIMFSGGRVFNDLSNYLVILNKNTIIFVSLMGAHSYSLWDCKNKLNRKIQEIFYSKGIKVDLIWLVGLEFENRLYRKNYSDILWPMEGKLICHYCVNINYLILTIEMVLLKIKFLKIMKINCF